MRLNPNSNKGGARTGGNFTDARSISLILLALLFGGHLAYGANSAAQALWFSAALFAVCAVCAAKNMNEPPAKRPRAVRK